MSLQPLEENVKRQDIEHVTPTTEKLTWRYYFWDSWDKSPEASTCPVWLANDLF